MRWADAPATYGLAALTAIVSLLWLVTGQLANASYGWGFVPALTAGDLALPGDFVESWVPFLPNWLTPLSATLVHGGPAHLGFNLIMLVFCGRQAERALGTSGLLLLYSIGAYLAAAGQWVVEPGSMVPMIGASGAISAIVGAYALLFGERRAKAVGPVPAGIVHVAWLAAGWIGVQVLVGATDGDQPVAVAAHVGGFLAGLALARPLLLWRWRGA